MDINEAIMVIEEELKGYNLNEERFNQENEVVIRCKNDKWIVYDTDERANKVTNSKDEYKSEEEALEDFIDRLRADKILRNL